MRRLFMRAAISAALIAPIAPAQASVINLGPIDLSGQGLGVSDPLLTLQATGGATTEFGTLFAVAGPTFGELAWTSAADVKLLFNPSEPQSAAGKSITLDLITLTFRSSSGSTLNLSNDAALVFPETDPGVGNSGFLLGLDASQALALAVFLSGAGTIADVSLGLSASLSDVAGAPETFRAVSGVPLPPALILFLSALVGFGLLGAQRITRTQRRL